MSRKHTKCRFGDTVYILDKFYLSEIEQKLVTDFFEFVHVHVFSLK